MKKSVVYPPAFHVLAHRDGCIKNHSCFQNSESKKYKLLNNCILYIEFIIVYTDVLVSIMPKRTTQYQNNSGLFTSENNPNKRKKTCSVRKSLVSITRHFDH